jgi:hypothetical protein
MAAIRRVYLYVVCAISLNALVWALISLFRQLSLDVGGTEDLALEIAVSVVSLGMFLTHWLWAGRLSSRSIEERQSGLRRFYLYASLAGFFGPLLGTLYGMLANLLNLVSTEFNYPNRVATTTEQVIYDLIAILVLALWMGYHLRVVRSDEQAAAGADRHTGIRRLFIYTFSTVGLTSLIAACVTLVDLVIYGLAGDIRDTDMLFKSTLPGLIIGLAVWLFFWLLAQRLFRLDLVGERLSVVRKLYQYGFIFAGALSVVFNTALIINEVMRRIMDLRSLGDWREPLPVMLVMGIVWLYHAVGLRGEQTAQVLGGRAGGIQRLYHYLVAAIGLLAVLAGLVGLIAVILISIEDGFGSAEREMLAWTVSALLVGLPVWLLPWLRLQAAARSLPQPGDSPDVVMQNTVGEDGRSSLVRKIYLYLFIFLATISVLGGLIFIAFRLVGAGLGLGAPTLSELGIAMAFTLIGVGVWLYHGQQLRSDGRLTSQSAALQIQQINILVLALPGSEFAGAVRTRLNSEMPQATLTVLELSPEGLSTDWQAQVNAAGVLLLPLDAWNQAPETLRLAVQASPARKLLAPQPVPGWAIAGLDLGEDLLGDLVQALRQLAVGQAVRPHRPLGAWAILGIILLVITVIMPLFTFLLSLIANNW